MASDRPFIFTIANLDEKAAGWRADVDPLTRGVSYRRVQKELRWLKAFVANPKNTVVMHEAPFDINMTRVLGFEWNCRIEDTKSRARVLNPLEEAYGLKPLCEKYFDWPTDDLAELKAELTRARSAAKKKGWAVATQETHGNDPSLADYWLCDPKKSMRYGMQDALRTICLFQMQQQLFDELKAAGRRVHEIQEWEQKLIPVVVEMDRYGMTYRRSVGQKLRKHYSDYQKEQRRVIAKLGYPDLNLQSPKQLVSLFCGKLGRETRMWTKGGKKQGPQPKIDSEQLMYWARGSQMGADIDGDGPDGCKLSRALLEWKAAKKNIEFFESYEFFSCRRKDGSSVVHPFWKPDGTITGRFSCADPNAMQFTRAETTRRHSIVQGRIREAFGPRPKHVWYAADYGQLEVWIFAFGAKSKPMMKALLEGHDFHTSTAHTAWHDRPDFCTCKKSPANILDHKAHEKGCRISWWRQRAKLILFSRFYGGGIGKIMELMRCTRKEAEEFVEQFDSALPDVQRFMEYLSDQVLETGILTNFFGREYPIEPRYAYRSVNYLIQGTAAEIVKRAMARISDYFQEQGWEHLAHLIAQVHDEIVNEVHQKLHSPELMSTIIKLMQADSQAIPNLKVPLPVVLKWTKNDYRVLEKFVA